MVDFLSAWYLRTSAGRGIDSGCAGLIGGKPLHRMTEYFLRNAFERGRGLAPMASSDATEAGVSPVPPAGKSLHRRAANAQWRQQTVGLTPGCLFPPPTPDRLALRHATRPAPVRASTSNFAVRAMTNAPPHPGLMPSAHPKARIARRHQARRWHDPAPATAAALVYPRPLPGHARLSDAAAHLHQAVKALRRLRHGPLQPQALRLTSISPGANVAVRPQYQRCSSASAR